MQLHVDLGGGSDVQLQGCAIRGRTLSDAAQAFAVDRCADRRGSPRGSPRIAARIAAVRRGSVRRCLSPPGDCAAPPAGSVREEPLPVGDEVLLDDVVAEPRDLGVDDSLGVLAAFGVRVVGGEAVDVREIREPLEVPGRWARRNTR